MIIYSKNHINAYTGAHKILSRNIRHMVQHIGVNVGGAPANILISQSRGTMRVIQSRIFGRVN